MSDEEENEYIPCKVVLLGETGVGKTSILTRYVCGTFSQLVMTSTGSSFVTKNLDVDEKNKVKFQIWDTAGQEKYRSLAKIFYQSASVAILVYDITTRNSFDGIKDYWSKEILANSPEDIIIALVANKSDDYYEQQVSTQEGKDLAKEINAIFQCTSAKLGSGIDELFKLIAEKFIDPTKNISESFMNKEEIIEQKRKIKIEEIRAKSNENIKKEKKTCCSK
jgi:Ras-related protein Rab-5C